VANVGPFEILVVLVIALVVFGPKRLPELGRTLGDGIKGFREAMSGVNEEPARVEEKAPDQPESAVKDD
jgi:sec-independent protein translocase protein TatA